MPRTPLISRLFAAAALAALMLTPGCSLFSGGSTGPDGKSVAAVNYSDEALHNYKQGKYYSSAGRYELAREYYLMAMASAADPLLQEAISHDLAAVDYMIRMQR